MCGWKDEAKWTKNRRWMDVQMLHGSLSGSPLWDTFSSAGTQINTAIERRRKWWTKNLKANKSGQHSV